MPPVARDRAGSTRKKRSNTRCWCSGAIPMPRSVTAISTKSPTSRRDTETDALAGEYAMAFSTRFDSAVTSNV